MLKLPKAMQGWRVRHGWLDAVRLCCVVALWLCLPACGSKTRAPSGLVVVVDTELSLPKDFDHVRFEVSQFGRPLQEELSQVGEGNLLLPARFQVASPGNSNPVVVRAVALKQGVPRIQREAVTPVPDSYVGRLRLSLNYLCDGTAELDGSSTCPDEQTCVQGTCKSSVVPPAQVPRDSKPEPMGTAPAPTDPDACFDVLACLDSARSVDLDTEDCSFALPASASTHLNVALEFGPVGQGICSDEACWVVLDRGSDGFAVAGSRVLLPEAVCAPRAATPPYHVVFSTACASKSAALPNCGPWSSGSKPLESPPLVGRACSGPGSEACGACGTRSRSCQSGTWSAWSACSDEGECSPDATEACGRDGQRTCGGDCHYGECRGQTCEGPSEESCGYCGTRTRSCENGTYSAWSACQNSGECEPDTSEACGNGGTRTCGGDCVFRPCSGQLCSGPAARSCGHCGTQTRSCDNGVWSEWGDCTGEGECAPDTTEACGQAGTRTCGGSCQFGACTGQTCEGFSERACGNCGTQNRICNNGTWSAWSDCIAEKECAPNQVLACGAAGTKVCSGSCTWGSCEGQTCEGLSTGTCGQCGTTSRTCNNGVWSAWSPCGSEGPCSPGTSLLCEGGTQVKTCDNSCQWSACAGNWSEWRDDDSPGGNGDYEVLSHFVDAGGCAMPLAIECQTLDGIDHTATGQVYSCTVSGGGVCANANQPGGSCLDYHVRYLCP